MDDVTTGPIRLVMLFGGRSAEHDISRVSARHVLAATDADRYDIVTVGITRDGRWIRTDPHAEFGDAIEIVGEPVNPFDILTATDGQRVVVFPLLHGPMGEDGTVQGLIEVAGVAYVGCGVLSSALAMDKSAAKEILTFNSIPQARWVSLTARDLEDIEATIALVTSQLGLPVFVKPANMGSSIGISKAHDAAELRSALALAFSYDNHVVCEETIEGREVECAVLGNASPEASVPGEIIPGADFYDFEDKYSSGTADLVVPADLDVPTTEAIRAMAIDTYRALRCEGMARVDFFYEHPGRGLLVNEVNTIPGFTPISMYPRLWAASGIGYTDLIDALIDLALERYDRRAQLLQKR